MAAAILSILILVGCPNDGGTDSPTVTDIEVITQETTEVTKGIPLQFGAKVFWSDNTVTTITPAAAAENADQIRKYIVFTITSTISAGDPTTGTRISDTGLLIVALSETAPTITVKGAYKDNTDLYSEKTLTVNADVTATVTSISINGDAGVNKGSSIMLTAAVDTTPTNADKSVTWSIKTSGIASGTSLSSTAGSSVTLTVDESESNTSIIVKIVSNLDESKTATKTVSVNEQPPPITSAIDFKTKTNANLLGLYPASNYTDAIVLIEAMHARAENAKIISPPASIAFYNPTPHPDPDKDFNCGNVAGVAPAMAWFIDNNELVVYGEAGNATIIFNVAVINALDGTGWITEYDKTYNTRSDTISIATLTNEEISTFAGYNVYIIVRELLPALSGYDFNDQSNPLNIMNVIDITPTIP